MGSYSTICQSKQYLLFLGLCFINLILFTNTKRCLDPQSQLGECVPLPSCPSLTTKFYSHAELNVNITLGAYICDFDGSNYLVCCQMEPSIPIVIRSSTISTITSWFQFASLTEAFNLPQIPYASSSSNDYYQYSTVMSAMQESAIPDKPNIYKPLTTVKNFSTPLKGVNQVLNLDRNNKITTQLDCGISSHAVNRVIGGMEARTGVYPWIAAIGYADEYDSKVFKFLCAGNLISSRYVVTSAHCLRTTLKIVRLGAHDLSKSIEKNAVDIAIKRTIAHEEFDTKLLTNDIALIELMTSVLLSDHIRTICLPESSHYSTEEFVGMNPIIAGWGAVVNKGVTSNVLRDAQVPIISRKSCEQSYKSLFSFLVFSDKIICAGNANIDACQGDSGGPLMLPQLVNGVYRFHLLGVVSFGYECARSGFPGIYTKIVSYVPWIKDKLE